MNKLFGMAVMAATLCATAGSALADERIAQKRGINARVAKVQLGGVINLHITQGATPSLVLIGDKDNIAKVIVTQNGDTLNIDSEGTRSWHIGNNKKYDVRAELTVPNLNELVSHGVGATDVRGFTGKELKLSLDGAGSVNVDSTYQNLTARLGGVGSMTLKSGNADQVDIKLRGAGHIEISGTSKLLRADLGGVGGLDAQKLVADTVELDMSGLGSASVYAKNGAKVKLSGMGSATVYGKPATRTADAKGMGSISWE
ncbi:GIN domain-containing protein [Massilia sp. TSP1-1-2]|uniref:GIN domain-containing protein n=1 Tax=unclassified Massilia TaxID=2609279 RepID=UPI003CF18A08